MGWTRGIFPLGIMRLSKAGFLAATNRSRIGGAFPNGFRHRASQSEAIHYLGQYWNNLNAPGGGSIYLAAGTGLANLITTNNLATGLGLVINNGNFQANEIVNGGLLNPSYALLGNFAVTNATKDYIFTTAASGAGLALTNLDPTAVYRLRMFGTRNTDASTTRTSQDIVTGGNGPFTNILQTSGSHAWTNNGVVYYGNINTIISVNGTVPDANNQIQLGLPSVAGGYAYLGIMEITANHPPVANNNGFRRNGLNA